MHAAVHVWSPAAASPSGTAEARPRRGPSRAAYEGAACAWRTRSKPLEEALHLVQPAVAGLFGRLCQGGGVISSDEK